MLDFLKRKRTAEAVALSAAALILLSFFLSGVYSGRDTAVSAVSESVSVINRDKSVTVEDILKSNGIENIFLPELFLKEKPISVKTEKCKKYTETAITAENAFIAVRDYNYPYLIEDEPVKTDDGAVRTNVNGVDFFISDNENGECTLLYYKDAARYIITSKNRVEEIASSVNSMKSCTNNSRRDKQSI